MKKLWIVYNPRSSRHGAVEAEVLAEARKITGLMIGKYEIKATSVEKNVEALGKLLMDGDFVVAAGGDGTATVAANAVLRSKKKATFTALGYGNFNDMARMLGGKENIGALVRKYQEGITEKAYPIEILVNGESWRYAMCYATFGLFAESTEVFDDEKVRKKLRSGRKSRVFSWWTLAKWYFKNRKKRDFIPECSLNGVKMPIDTTDYVAMNGARMGGVMKGKGWMFTKGTFGRATGRLKSFPKLVGLMSKSVLSKVPTVEATDDVIEMAELGEIEVQVEGEYRRLKGVSRIEVRKAKSWIEVVRA